MAFTLNKYPAPRTIEKIKIPRAILELPAKALPIQPIYLKTGPNWPIGSAVWLVAPKGLPGF